MRTTRYVTSVTVVNPNTLLPEELEVHYDPDSNALFAIDGEFADKHEYLISPYTGRKIKIDESVEDEDCIEIA